MQMADFEKRMQTINRRIGQMVDKGEREVARDYARLLTEIRSMLANEFEKFEQGGKLTLDEMLKHDRLTKFMQEVNRTLRVNYRDVGRKMDAILADAYLDGYYLTAWAIEAESRTKLGYSAMRPETLSAMIANPVAGLTLNERLERNRGNIIYAIQQQVTQGLQKNESYGTMAKRLKNELEGDAVKAMRIVRTEGHRVQESAKHDAAEHANDNGVVMMKEWNTLEDSRVRKGKKTKADHKKLNNKRIPTDEDFDDGLGKGPQPGELGEAGSDINCRCFLTYSIEKIEKPQYKELEAITFDKWKKERLRK